MKPHFHDLPEGQKLVIDGISVSALLGILIDVLPAIASLLTIIWTVIRIYETRTVQGWLGRVPPPGCDPD